MTNNERAAQVWSVLALAARNRQTLTYGMVAGLTGLAQQGLGRALDPIQNYCASEGLPPLTALVVKQGSGVPSDGFEGSEDAPSAQARVFDRDWIGLGNPGPDALGNAPPLRS